MSSRVMSFLATMMMLACGGTAATPDGTTFTVGGTITGLTGTGLTLSDGHDDLAIDGDGAFTFPTALRAGTAFQVDVTHQPTAPAQQCLVAGGDGTVTADVTTIVVTCTTGASTYAIGGTVTGLTSAGLVLQNNGGDDLAIASSGPFTFATPLAANATYSVTIKAQPAGLLCTIASATGTAQAPVTDVAVTCVDNTSGITVTPPSVTVTADTGTSTAPQQLTIKNLGTNPQPITVTLTHDLGLTLGPDYAGLGGSAFATLAAGETRSFTLTMSASASGTYHGTATVTPATGTAVPVALTLTSTASFSPTSPSITADIPYTALGGTYPATNLGIASDQVTAVAVTGGALPAGLSLDFNQAGGSYRILYLVGTTTATGTFPVDLTITTTAGTVSSTATITVSPSQFHGTVSFTSPGNASWTFPVGVTTATVSITGAGGGGACADATTAGGNGSSGDTNSGVFIAKDPSGTIAIGVAIGGGGSGGVANTGTTLGGFGTYSPGGQGANGGGGGGGGSNARLLAISAAPGSRYWLGAAGGQGGTGAAPSSGGGGGNAQDDNGTRQGLTNTSGGTGGSPAAGAGHAGADASVTITW